MCKYPEIDVLNIIVRVIKSVRDNGCCDGHNCHKDVLDEVLKSLKIVSESVKKKFDELNRLKGGVTK